MLSGLINVFIIGIKVLEREESCMSYVFAERVSYMESSAIREILKVTEQPEVISFAGGLPAPELFPLAEIRESYAQVLGVGDPSVLQYSTTEGFLPLRLNLAAQMKNKGIKVGPDNILLTNGSQQGLDLLTKLLINPGDFIIVEDPTYLGALQTFRSYQARFATVPMDSEGIDIEALEYAIKQYHPKMIYLTPTFKNPTGITFSTRRRQEIASVLSQYNIPLIEDDPYGELRYSGSSLPPIKSFDKEERVIYLGTFSKTVAPGLRLGWVVASEEMVAKLVLAKQGTDLHTGTILQRATHYYLENFDVQKHLNALRSEYKSRRDLMLAEMRANFPAQIHWTEPEGGMFVWVTLADPLDSISLLRQAVEAKVAYVPGVPFYANGGGNNTLRLNFSNSSSAQIKEGIRRLGRIFTIQ